MFTSEVFGTSFEDGLYHTIELHYVLTCMVEELATELERADASKSKDDWMNIAHSRAWDRLAEKKAFVKRANLCNEFVKELYYNHSK